MFVASVNSIGSCLGSVGSGIYSVGSGEDAGIGFGAGFLDSIRFARGFRLGVRLSSGGLMDCFEVGYMGSSWWVPYWVPLSSPT